ncbi:dephospho-CoA kinase [Vibrio vulnificus YJ016]|uniref:Dephospho-CoA kinase n=3 Tax=Vibrio vulnificus TaxID=672 RepID=COAE_VIBVY|nr:dephospho-CoA kinase [Vibrio vulnificus]Q7MHT5.1 RecName: Full=Dephospho-CoA kinase; AltName: Full=Dephosphocoenzyme A kinase [Vibrio vulnificus YJ016]ADV85545.1 dephospho-CoA kinase [Vibrio vulnificus MO6-24/O]EGR0036974.1 dephospho-CoA kinase [Vibrio vulnificus]EGR0089952.1 dephospho-CoA kinase [Vibrio vulnificus]EGR0094497.1 dephospho-CoA kinase [Vibrio vulnificus]EGR7942431.1 dephospho-CoA kinase [Vibrio vulnificus]
MALVIGLTGGIASGKTTVANLFQQHFAIDIVDADIVARQVVAPGSAGLAAIVDHFGADILTREGELDRGQLRQRIFAHAEEKQWLNALLHPMIRRKMIEDLAQVSSPYALLVVPLLVENQLQTLCDRVLVVDVEEKTQLQRTMDRDGVDEQQVRAILKAQASRHERLALADDVIKNESKDQDLLQQITDLHQKYLAMSKQNR